MSSVIMDKKKKMITVYTKDTLQKSTTRYKTHEITSRGPQIHACLWTRANNREPADEHVDMMPDTTFSWYTHMYTHEHN